MNRAIDLHEDRSDNALCTTHKDFFAKECTHGWNAEKMNALNQVDLRRLQQGKMRAVIGAIFIDPDAMAGKNGEFPIDAAKFELYRHLKYYDWVIEKSQGQIYEILSGADLSQERAEAGQIGLLKHLEGFYFADPLDRNFTILDDAYVKGVRSIAMTWGVDSNMAGGNEKNIFGLNMMGKEFVEKLASKKMLIDLAHISQKGFADIMDIVKKPVMVSHTKITDRDDKPRFLTFPQARRVANGGGILGIMTMKSQEDQFPVTNLVTYVAHIKEAIKIVGVDHVSIGTDFDGLTRDHAISDFEDIGDMEKLYNEMKHQHMKEEEIEKVLSNNALRFIQENI